MFFLAALKIVAASSSAPTEGTFGCLFILLILVSYFEHFIFSYLSKHCIIIFYSEQKKSFYTAF
jgi:hypothetical protein